MNLYDASAFFNLMRLHSAPSSVLSGHVVLDLTRYEIGNTICKLTRMEEITGDQARDILGVSMRMLHRMTAFDIGMEEDARMISVSNDLTFYDSAYVVVAEKHDLSLVTDDRKLYRIASQRGILVTASGY